MLLAGLAALLPTSAQGPLADRVHPHLTGSAGLLSTVRRDVCTLPVGRAGQYRVLGFVAARPLAAHLPGA